uniref:Uncharacterized protein n=1 Tax=Arundo donax TaxID=35708 RepID=A0A0A9AN38_ARUDO
MHAIYVLRTYLFKDSNVSMLGWYPRGPMIYRRTRTCVMSSPPVLRWSRWNAAPHRGPT